MHESVRGSEHGSVDDSGRGSGLGSGRGTEPSPRGAAFDAPVRSGDEIPFGFGPSLSLLERSLDGLTGCGIPAHGDSIVAVRAHIDRLQALVAEAEVRFDANEVWRDEGAGSLRAWLADRGGLSRRGATGEAKRIERLESWPEVREAWSSGELSGAQVDVVVGTVPRRFVSLFAHHAPRVVCALAPLDVEQTAIAMRQWVRAAEAADGADDFRDRPSGLFLDQTFDGNYLLRGQLNPAEAAIIDAAIRVFDVPDEVDEHGERVGDRRTTGRRQVDALVAACSFALNHRDGGGESGRFQPHISLVVDVQELRAAGLRGAGVTTLADLDRCAEQKQWSAVESAWFAEALTHHGDAVTAEGLIIDASALSALSCDSIVQAVLTNGSQVLRLGRTERTAQPGQRRAIIARDRHCRAPGCRTKARYCDVHHVDHWVNGGRTDVDRMVLLCGTHHREFHKAGYSMELAEDATLTVTSPKGWVRRSTPERAEAPVFRRGVRRGSLQLSG